MKRRDFLKILGIAPAVVAVPALAKSNNDNVFRIGDKPDGSKVLGGGWTKIEPHEIDVDSPVTSTFIEAFRQD